MQRIAIIGGGISGLTCAYELSKLGFPLKIFEEEEECGGRCRNIVVEGLEMPIGAVSMSPLYRNLLGLVVEIGLRQRVKQVSGSRIGFYLKGGVLKGTAISLLFAKQISWREKILYGRLMRLADNVAQWKRHRSLEEVSLKDYILKNYSASILQDFVEPMMRSTCLASEEICAAQGLQWIAVLPKMCLLEGGNVLICRRIVEELLDSVATNVKIDRVERRSNGKFLVSHNGEREEFDIVVCSVPLPIAKEILPDVDIPDLKYGGSRLLIVKGDFLYPELMALGNSDYEKSRVISITNYGKYHVAAVVERECDLSPFFKEYVVVGERYWRYASPFIPPHPKIPSLETDISNLYLCGDFYLYGGLESSVLAGMHVARLIQQSKAR